MNELGRIRSLWLWGLIVTMAFAGCTGGYGKFYNRLCMTDLPPVKHAEVYAYSDQTLQDSRSRGYIVVGYSSFNGALEDKSLAVNQSKKNGADIVLLRQAYTGSTQTTLALPQYHAPQTTTVNSHQSGTVNAYGSGGYAYGNGAWGEISHKEYAERRIRMFQSPSIAMTNTPCFYAIQWQNRYWKFTNNANAADR